jgi:ABC-type glycerol-3-phosphate transport system substrate-binding protein
MRKSAIVAIITALFAFILSSTAPAQGPITLRFWQSNTAQAESYKKEVALFERENPGIRVELTTLTTDQYTQALNLAFRGGTGPDLFRIPTTGVTFNQVLDFKWMRPLNRWATREWQAGFPPNSFADGVNRFDGVIYSAPFDGRAANRYTLYVNNRVFREAGLVDAAGRVRVPRTWDEARAAARQIAQRSDGRVHGYGIGFKTGDFHAFLQTWGVRASGSANTGSLDAVDTAFDWRTGSYQHASNPVWTAWFRHWFDMIEDGSIYPGSATLNDEQVRAQFGEGRFGMHISGPWVPGSLKTTNPGFEDYTIAQVPMQTTRPQGTYYYATPGGRYLAMANATRYPNEAWRLYAFLHSRESATRWVGYGDTLRVFPETAEAATGKTRDLYRVQLSNVRLAPAFTALRPQLQDVKRTPVASSLASLVTGAYAGTLKRTDLTAALARLEADSNAQLARDIETARRGGVNVNITDFAFPNWNPALSQFFYRQ